ncbi:MAG: hypothetical protein HYR91_07360 [Flavobacteriia bacterium]|nr:hypothetical protein [Flavobacteriia bacterium]
MKQDDYFLNQIDILGRILGKVIADLLQLNSPDNILQIDFINEAFKNGLDFNLDEIKVIPDEDFLNLLLKNPKINLDNLEKLAETLRLISLKSETELTKKALLLYLYVNQHSTTYSADRILKLNSLNTKNE